MTRNLPKPTPCIALISSDWLQRLAGYETLWVGLSGGLDSVVLLHQVAHQPDLNGRVSAVHIHHGLSQQADAWLHHCQSLCRALGVPFTVRHVAFERRANIEANARHARFDAFAALMADGDGLLLAHHADDQAETLLLQLFRGAGVDGMAAMPAVKPLGRGHVVRPFLMHPRRTLEAYAHKHQLTWVEDESNEDVAFSRNYLRHEIMPLLQERWPGVGGNLVRAAEHCQQAKDNLAALASLDCAPHGAEKALSSDTLPLALIQALDPARAANVLRSWLTNHRVRMPSTQTFYRIMSEVVLACDDAQACVAWDGMAVRRYQQTLYLLGRANAHAFVDDVWSSFPACIDFGAQGSTLCASIAVAGLHVPSGCQIEVRFRRGGELFPWRGQTKSLKQLFQQWRVPPWQRGEVPLIYIDGRLAQVVGFAVSDLHYRKNMPYTYHIELHREPACHSH